MLRLLLLLLGVLAGLSETLAQTPVAWYKLDETTGTVIADSSGNGYNGTIVGGKNAANMTVQGTRETGRALQFDGTADYTSAPSTPAPVYPFSIAGWCKPLAPNEAYGMLFGHSASSSSSNYCSVGINSSYFLSISRRGDVTDLVVTSVPVKIGVWQHVAAVFHSSTEVSLYLDGVQVYSNAALTAVTLAGSLNTHHIGVWRVASPVYFYEGSMADVRFYANILTAAQVQTIYNEGLDLTTNLVAHYPLQGEYASTTVPDNVPIIYDEFLKGLIATDTDGYGETPFGWNQYIYPSDHSFTGDRSLTGGVLTLTCDNTAGSQQQLIGMNRPTTLTTGNYYSVECRFRVISRPAVAFGGALGFYDGNWTWKYPENYNLNEWYTVDFDLGQASNASFIPSIFANAGHELTVEIDYIKLNKAGVLSSGTGVGRRTPGPGGQYTHALNLLGGVYVDCPLPTLAAPYSIVCWVKHPPTLAGNQKLIDMSGAESHPYFTFLTASTAGRFLLYAGSEQYRYGNHYLVQEKDRNKWYHVAFVLPSTTRTDWRLYLNGQDSTGTTGAGSTTYYEPSGTTFQVGTSQSLADVRVYKGALTQAQVQAIYLLGLSAKNPGPVLRSSTIR